MKKKLSIIRFKLDTDDIKSHRYASIDDWWNPREWTNELHFKTVVGDTGNADYNFLVLIHALIEQYLCYKHGISDEEVTKFDIDHPELPNPGDSEDAPYHKEHGIATDIEAKLANILNVNWIKYEEAIDKTLKRWRKK